MVALIARDGDIFTPEYFEKLEAVTQEMYGMPGVDQSSVTSLFTPNVRFTEVVEDGFTGGNVVPSDFPVGKDNRNCMRLWPRCVRTRSSQTTWGGS